MPKTQKDLFLALLDRMGGGGPQGAMMRASFEQQLLPSLKKSAKWDEAISDEDFERQLAAMEKELPAFIHHVLTMKTAPLPPDFGTKN